MRKDLITEKLDECYRAALGNIEAKKSIGDTLPRPVRKNIDTWKFGEYGWTSPVNLLITAAWVKWIKPSQDVCRIWARDEEKKSIEGGFSIRRLDESFTIPFVTKYQIFEGFCSPNSGMQGTRALEKNKLRAEHKRIDRDSDLGQRVTFDIQLFKDILNDINASEPQAAREIFIYFIEHAIRIKEKIKIGKSSIPCIENLRDDVKIKDIIFTAVQNIKDPQFTKVVAFVLLCLLFKEMPKLRNCKLVGLEGSQTAADARARTPGDLWLTNSEGTAIVGCEIKDKTKSIGFDVLGGISTRIKNNPTLKHYILISAASEVIASKDRNDPQWNKILRAYEKQGILILAISLEELYNIVSLSTTINQEVMNLISESLKRTRDLKSFTIQAWTSFLKAC